MRLLVWKPKLIEVLEMTTEPLAVVGLSSRRGAVISAKFQKKLQRPKNWQIFLRLDGGLACVTALSLSSPGRIPCSVRQKPK